MNRNNRFMSSSTRTVAGRVPTSNKAMKAKCAQNQPGLDRLQELKTRTEEKNPNSNYVLTIHRAMKSLRDCPNEITTQKEACALKFIGPSMAKIICPRQLQPPSQQQQQQQEQQSQRPLVASLSQQSCDQNFQQMTLAGTKATAATTKRNKRKATTTATTTEQGPTAKQRTYENEVKRAEEIDLSTSNMAGPWKVILLVDGREHKSKHVVSKCKQSGIPCEERHLPIGDMTWIAKSDTGTEIMLGTIIERKESSDLVQSLFGTRYLEQRLRLQNCGLPQLLFLVEGDLAANSNCPKETLVRYTIECLSIYLDRFLQSHKSVYIYSFSFLLLTAHGNDGNPCFGFSRHSDVSPARYGPALEGSAPTNRPTDVPPSI